MVTLLLATGCSPKNNATRKNMESFIIGSGGGVSGLYEQYRIFENGKIEQYNFETKSYQSYTNLSASANSSVWNAFRSLDVKKFEIDDPGNYTYYIKWENNGTMQKILWSDETALPLKELRKFFADTEFLVKNTQ